MELSELINQAEKESKWLHCSYQDLWFSPNQLREHNSNGRFKWGIDNWSLRDPQEKLKALRVKVDNAKLQADEFEKMLKEGTNLMDI